MLKIAVLFISLLGVALAGPGAAADAVTTLPDYGDITGFEFYSGYLTVTDSVKLHYVFVTSQNDPTTDPVIVWFNGGPGCSSMEGFFEEHGPFVQDEGDPAFFRNEYSWNMFANVMYLESPGGVGYSICGDTADCTFDDDTTAQDNLVALLDFFENKFPEYLPNDLYLSGESYAGIYVPYLLDQVHLHNEDEATTTKLNLIGMMVGNGVTNYEIETFSQYLEMAYWHGLISDDIHYGLIDNGCYDLINNDETLSLVCDQLIIKFEQLTANINPYNLYGTCWGPDDQRLRNGVTEARELHEILNEKVSLRSDYTPWLWKNKKLGTRLMELPPCTWGQPLIDYLRRDDVKTALHIPSNAPAWDLCTSDITYHSLGFGSQWVYQKYHGKYRVLVFSGDTDGVVPTDGTLAWIDQYVTKLRLSIDTHWYPYYYVDDIAGPQVAGFFEEYEGRFCFATVHGAGHMVPMYKRQQSFVLFTNWIKATPPPGRGEV